MARQRFIHPGIWTDPVLGRLAPPELLLYIGCFSNADDEGRLLGDPAFLKSVVFPYQKFSELKIRRMRDIIVKSVRRMEMYEVDGVEFLNFLNFQEWQKPKYPSQSKLPAPPGNSGNVPPMVGEGSPTGLGWVGKYPPNPPQPKKKKGESAITATGDDLTLLEERTVRRGRRRDELWDAMVLAFHAGEFTKTSRGQMNRAVAELREIEAKPGDVQERKTAYERRYPDVACTPSALVKHWPYLNGGPKQPTTAAEKNALDDERRRQREANRTTA